MTEQQPPEGEDDQQQQAPEGDDEQQQAPEGDDEQQQAPEGEPEGDTFPREYVTRLRDQNATYRKRSRDMETRAVRAEHALFTERVRGLGILADPADLPFSEDLLADPDALAAAVDDLVKAKPHLRRRGTAQGVGSHERHEGDAAVSLLGLMRRNT